ncbi:MAG: hypothetical protein GXO80_07455 [Chlorobi bacterium]|nr:hypothetical protein [Chlorobiota bacterium]
MLKKYLLFIFLTVIIKIGMSQENENMKILFDKLEFAKNDNSKDSVNNIILSETENILSEGNFSELKGIKNISCLISSDKKMSIVTWPVLYSDNTFKYFGFVRYYERDFGRFSVEKLTDKSENIVNPERQILNPENWYGAFYYKIIYKKYKRRKIYVLLGWDGNNDLTNRKIIDVFYLNEDNEPTFGKEIFESENSIKDRLFFEYREGIAMNLSYDKKKELIIWDHLSPSKPELKGHYEYYGPDLTFDALKFEEGIWKYIPDIDLSK